VEVPNNAFASSFVLKSEKPQQKHIDYCSKHTMKMQWVVHKCLTGSVDLKKGRQVRSKTKVMLLAFLVLRVSYTMSTLPTGKQLTRNSTWRSCDVCVNQFAEKNRKNGKMATGSCTTTMRPHTLHVLCSSFWPNTALLSCRSCHTHQISHRVTFLFPRLKKFLKGHRFEAMEDIKRNSMKTLLDIPKEELAKCFEQWQQCWAKCVAVEGNYVENN